MYKIGQEGKRKRCVMRSVFGAPKGSCDVYFILYSIFSRDKYFAISATPPTGRWNGFSSFFSFFFFTFTAPSIDRFPTNPIGNTEYYEHDTLL